MSDQTALYPTIPVTVNIGTDGHVTSVVPLNLPVYGPSYIVWTFVGATSPEQGTVTLLPPAVFPLEPAGGGPGITVKHLDLCKPPGGKYTYKVGLLGGPLIDPSIDNYPNSDGGS